MYPSLRDWESTTHYLSDLRRQASEERLARLASRSGPSSHIADSVRLRLGLLFVHLGARLLEEPAESHRGRRLTPTP